MKIQSMVGIDGCTLVIYRRSDRLYGFSIIDLNGIVYTCDSSFSSVDSANLLAMTAMGWEM